MNSYERVAAALAHREADRVPVCPLLCGAGRRLTGARYPKWSTDAETCAASYLKVAETYDVDCLVTLIDLSVECDAWGQKIVYPENEAAHPDYADKIVSDIDDYQRIQTVDYRRSARMNMHIEVCARLMRELKGKIPVAAFVFGPLGTLSMMRSQQDLYTDLYDDPDAVRGAVGRVAGTLREYAAALCDTGVDAIMWDTLFASGSIMSKAMWRDMEAEPMRMLAQSVREHGVMNMIHNCGRRIYFDAQIEAIAPSAISFLYPPDDCADFAECKAKYGDKVTLIGCVSPSAAVTGTDAEWDEQCVRQIETMGAGGGFMLATGCEYPANAPFERAERMIRIAKTSGAYR